MDSIRANSKITDEDLDAALKRSGTTCGVCPVLVSGTKRMHNDMISFAQWQDERATEMDERLTGFDKKLGEATAAIASVPALVAAQLAPRTILPEWVYMLTKPRILISAGVLIATVLLSMFTGMRGNTSTQQAVIRDDLETFIMSNMVAVVKETIKREIAMP